ARTRPAIVTSARIRVAAHSATSVDTPLLAKAGVIQRKVVANRKSATPPTLRTVNMSIISPTSAARDRRRTRSDTSTVHLGSTPVEGPLSRGGHGVSGSWRPRCSGSCRPSGGRGWDRGPLRRRVRVPRSTGAVPPTPHDPVGPFTTGPDGATLDAPAGPA